MKVKVGNKIYDATKEPIMVILSKGEQQQITDMHPDATKYCMYPNPGDPEKIKEWMSG